MAVKMVKGTSLALVRTGFVDEIDGVGPLNPRQFKPAKIEVGHAGTLHGPYHSNTRYWHVGLLHGKVVIAIYKVKLDHHKLSFIHRLPSFLRSEYNSPKIPNIYDITSRVMSNKTT